MAIASGRSGATRACGLGAALLMLACGACARRAAHATSSATVAAPAAEVRPSPPAAGLGPYTIERLPKSQAVRIDQHTVRGAWGVPLEVVAEDDDAYQVKRYAMATAPIVPRPTPAAARRSRAADDAPPRTSVGHRLRFRPFGAGLPTSGQWRDGFGIADMNGDGHPDLVHGPPRKALGAPAIFLGDGHGTWRRWAEARFPARLYDYGDARAADLNGDGHMDVVLAIHLHGLLAMLGDGQGTFTDASGGLDFAAESKDAGFSSRAIALADWDGDGRIDILALGEGPRLAMAPGAPRSASADRMVIYGNEGTRWQRHDGDARPIFGSSVTVGDFDGDGRLDFATGSGILGRRDLVDIGRADGGWTPTDVPIPAQAYVAAVAARDVDGDGRADLAVGYLAYAGERWRTALDVLSPRAGGTWERHALFATEDRTGVPAVATGDVDGDGHADIVALTGDGDTLVFTGNGRGEFVRQAGAIPRFPGGCRGAHVVLADLDGDGRDEVVASFAEERSSVSEAGRCPSTGGLSAWKLQ